MRQTSLDTQLHESYRYKDDIKKYVAQSKQLVVLPDFWKIAVMSFPNF